MPRSGRLGNGPQTGRSGPANATGGRRLAGSAALDLILGDLILGNLIRPNLTQPDLIRPDLIQFDPNQFDLI